MAAPRHPTVHKKKTVMVKCLIECVHGGHIRGVIQWNDFPLGNKCDFYANILCLAPPTWPP